MGLPRSHCTFHMEIPAALCSCGAGSAGLAGKKVMIIWEGTAGDPLLAAAVRVFAQLEGTARGAKCDTYVDAVTCFSW